jgi:hypothetical protein
MEALQDRVLLSFQGAAAFDAGGAVAAMAVGDFTGNGIQDIAIASPTLYGSLKLLLGNGDGTFQPPRSFEVNELPRSIAVGDFRHIGRLDVALGGVQDVVVLLGNGDGTFQSPVHYYAGSTSSIAVGDFRGDGHLDIAVTNRSAGLIGVFLGNGDGTFQSVRFSPAGRDPNGIAVGDFNEIGRDDIVVTNSFANQASVLESNGDGTFQPPVSYAVGTNPVAVAVGNFTVSGHRDIVVADKGATNGSGAGLSVLVGDGSGGFQTTGLINAGVAPIAVAVGDLNGDGTQDIAVSDEGHSTNGRVQVLLGNGDGTFAPAATYFAGPFGTSLVLGNIHGDGIDDIAVGNEGSTVDLLTGNGDGTFLSATNFAIDIGASDVAVGDFNGDGLQDIVAANSNSLSLFLGNGDGTFQSPVNIPLRGSAGSVAAADLRHNGIMDLVAIDSFGIEVLLGNGDGTFQNPVTYIAGEFPAYVTIADLNGDQFPDLVSLGVRGTISVWLNDGAGGFQNAGTYNIGDETASALTVGAFHGNGVPDLLVTGYKEEIDPEGNHYLVQSDINLFRGNGDGTFQPAVRQDVLRLGYPPPFLAVADFNGDGLPDLVFGAHILLNNGDATFRDAGTFRTGSRIVYVAAADINRDGRADLIVVNDVATVSVLLGNGDGTFQPALNYAVGPIPNRIRSGDFTGSGFPDLVSVNRGGYGSLTLLLNAADWPGPNNRSGQTLMVAATSAMMSGGSAPASPLSNVDEPARQTPPPQDEQLNRPAVLTASSSLEMPPALWLAGADPDGAPLAVLDKASLDDAFAYSEDQRCQVFNDNHLTHRHRAVKELQVHPTVS